MEAKKGYSKNFCHFFVTLCHFGMKKGQSRSPDLVFLVAGKGIEPLTRGFSERPIYVHMYELSACAEENSLLLYRTCVLFGVCANLRK